VPVWKTVSEPQAFAQALWAHAERNGAAFEKAEVRGLERLQAGPSRLADGSFGMLTRSSFAPGPGRRVCSTITKLRIPLETERGYNTTLPQGTLSM
jgi:D-amino-acid dehydrogenase